MMPTSITNPIHTLSPNTLREVQEVHEDTLHFLGKPAYWQDSYLPEDITIFLHPVKHW